MVNFFFKNGIVFNIVFDEGAGYIEMQCIKIIFVFIFFAKL